MTNLYTEIKKMSNLIVEGTFSNLAMLKFGMLGLSVKNLQKALWDFFFFPATKIEGRK